MPHLTETQAREIYARTSKGERHADLAREFKIHISTIAQIRSGRNWKRLNLKQIDPDPLTLPKDCREALEGVNTPKAQEKAMEAVCALSQSLRHWRRDPRIDRLVQAAKAAYRNEFPT